MMPGAMWIPAFLQGVRDHVAKAIPTQEQCRVRPSNDGRPGAAYQGGGWFVGVYWAGGQSSQGQSHESANLSLGVGVDVTRVQPAVPTRKLGDWFLQPGELHSVVGTVCELLLEQNWQVARLCNEAYARMLGGNLDGQFYEHFETATVGAVVNAPPQWILGVEADNSPVYYVRLAFAGLKFNKLRSEMAK